MQRKNTWYLALIFSLVVVCTLVSGVRINEVELNPQGTDSGNEWLELYSETEVNLTNWGIRNIAGKNMSFNASFSGYYILDTTYTLLTNDNEKLFLIDAGKNEVYETNYMNDSGDDGKTWQYCEGEWKFTDNTKNSENSCSPEVDEDDGEEAAIYLEVDWDEDEIINNDDFSIDLEVYNLKEEDYDIKIYITEEDSNTMMSEVYNDDDGWKSGTYYIEEAFTGPGNKSKFFDLRLKQEYVDFSGNVRIHVRIRKKDSSSIIAETEMEIKILESEEDSEDTAEQNTTTSQDTDQNTSPDYEIIKLNTQNINTQENTQTYRSKMQYIKEYSIYGFALFLLGLIIALILKNRF